jgi:hypothetical protein
MQANFGSEVVPGARDVVPELAGGGPTSIIAILRFRVMRAFPIPAPTEVIVSRLSRPGSTPKCILRVAALVGTYAIVLVSGCALVAPPTATPEAVSVPVSTGGPLEPIELRLHSCDYVEMEVHFPRSAFATDSDMIRLVGTDSWVPQGKAQPGVPLDFNIVVRRFESDRLGQERLADFQSWKYTAKGHDGGAHDFIMRTAGGTTLPAGHYRIDATLLEPAKELRDIPVTFHVWSSLKHTPNREQCGASSRGL